MNGQLWITETRVSSGKWLPTLHYNGLPGSGIYLTRFEARLAARCMQDHHEMNRGGITIPYRAVKYVRVDD